MKKPILYVDLDDDTDNANQTNFEGEWIKFDSEKFPNWSVIVNYLIEVKK